ncbi:hypothetical protein [Cellulosimicrobium cellulans]|uniref:hypothetical protein n=1 Tax=Cellulosimicrobium cellulans TaxID=1710 RepID=UPI0020CF5081|nr:hypothetical protein NMQ07_17755 [Cellulosimicrobium cellulans]
MSTYSSWRSDQGNMRALSDELAAQAAMARSREASLHRRLRSLEGDLSSRVEVLTRLVNALIELGEVREELVLFTPARRARDAARALTSAVVTGEGDVSHLRRSPDLVDVPGYWLVPAALAVAELPAGRLDREAAEEALLRDRRRAATYLVAVCALAGQPGLACEWTAWVLDAPALPAAGWGSADGAPEPSPGAGEAPDEVGVTGAERALWVAAAAGHLGGDGVEVVRRALAERVALLDDDARGRWRARLLEEAPSLPERPSEGEAWGSPEAAGGTAGTRRRAAAPDALPLLRSWTAWSRALVAGEVAVPAPTPGPSRPGPPRRPARRCSASSRRSWTRERPWSAGSWTGRRCSTSASAARPARTGRGGTPRRGRSSTCSSTTPAGPTPGARRSRALSSPRSCGPRPTRGPRSSRRLPCRRASCASGAAP